MREAHTFKLRKRFEEVLRKFCPRLWAGLEVGAHFSAEEIHGVVATPQNAVVFRQAVVVKLIRDVGQTLAVVPTKACKLCGR